MAELPKGFKLESHPDIGKPDLPEGFKLEPYKDPITAASEKVAPVAGRMGVEALPAAGSFFGPGGTLVGTGISQMMKRARPDLFGEQPQGFDAATAAGKELLLNNVLPAGLGKLGGLALKMDMQGIGPTLASELPNFPAVREGASKELAAQIQKQIGENYRPLGDYQPISIKPTSTDFQPIKITPGQEFKPFRKGQPYQPKTEPTVEASGPMKKVPSGEFEVIPGEVKAAQDRLGKLITKDKMDAAKTLDELTGENANLYKDAMPTDVYQNSKRLLETMKEVQKKGKMDMVLNYSGHKLLWSGAGLMTGGLTGNALGHPIAGLAIGGTPIVLNAVLDKIMSNPEAAKLVTLALTTPAKAPQASLIQKALTEILPRVIQGEADVAFTPQR